MEKNEAQISGFAVAKKSPKILKKKFSEKKFLTVYLWRYDLPNGVRNFGDLKVPKNCSSR